MTLAGKIFGVEYVDYDFAAREARRGGEKWLNKEKLLLFDFYWRRVNCYLGIYYL